MDVALGHSLAVGCGQAHVSAWDRVGVFAGEIHLAWFEADLEVG